MAAALGASAAPASEAQAAPQGAPPALVVGVIVDGLTADGLEQALARADAPSLRRLAAQGFTVTDLDYGTTDPTAARTVLLTGASASASGVDAATRFDREARRGVSVFHDPAYIGSSTTETLSPAPLRVTTLADELRLATDGRSRIYSIAPQAPDAIVGAGHAGGSGVWLSDTDGRWATTTWYKDIPQPVSEANYRRPLSARIDTMSWSGRPGGSPTGGHPFRYSFMRSDADAYRRLKASPRVNDEVTHLACDYLGHMHRTASSRTAAAPDMLTLGLTVAEYPYGTTFTTLAAEQADAYRRLDACLASLLAQIDRTYGLANTVVYLAGVPADVASRRPDAVWGLPAGEFSPRRATGLLNMYLIALHGNGEWVTGALGTRFYLNDKLAADRGLDPAALHTEAAAFLTRMSGVARAVTIEQMMASGHDVSPETAADVYIDINPGWTLTDTSDPSREGKSVRAVPPSGPLVVMAPGVAAGRVTTPVSARAVAPMLAGLLHIRPPTGASAIPLRLR